MRSRRMRCQGKIFGKAHAYLESVSAASAAACALRVSVQKGDRLSIVHHPYPYLLFPPIQCDDKARLVLF